MTSGWGFPDFDDHEGVHLFTDPASGLRAVIAVHSTKLGPAGGGCRFWHYADSNEAITDALRLSRGMSFKNAMAGLPMGGGKGVVLADANRTKTPELLKAFGRAIDSLGGRYVTAEDVGMSDTDMVTIATETKHVTGLPVASGRAGGNPGPSTALGVYLGVKAAAKRGLGADSMKGVHVAIQGIGSVGGGLAALLAKDGAKLTLADVDADKAAAMAKALGAEVRTMAFQEVGWQPLQHTAQAANSPWLRHVPGEFELFQWHGDTFDLPPGAQHVLTNGWCQNQAFTWGDKVLALQSHPEMTAELVDLWLTEAGYLLDASQPSQQSISFMRENLPQRIAQLNQVAEGFYRYWLQLAFA